MLPITKSLPPVGWQLLTEKRNKKPTLVFAQFIQFPLDRHYQSNMQFNCSETGNVRLWNNINHPQPNFSPGVVQGTEYQPLRCKYILSSVLVIWPLNNTETSPPLLWNPRHLQCPAFSVLFNKRTKWQQFCAVEIAW